MKKTNTTKLLGGGAILTVSAGISGVMGYFFQVIMGRILGPENYSLLMALMALLIFFNTPLQAIFTILTKNVAYRLATDSSGFSRSTYQQFIKLIFVIGSIFFAGIFLLSDIFMGAVKNATDVQIIILGLIVIATAVGQLNNAFYQANQLFFAYSSIGLVASFTKLFFSIAILKISETVDGALLGLLFSVIFTDLIFSYIFYYRIEKNKPLGPPQSSSLLIEWRAVPPVFASILSIALLSQIDLLFANNFFDSNSSGAYAAAAVIGKSVLYISNGIILALFPIVAASTAQRKNTLATFKTALAASFIIGLVFSMICFVFAEFIVLVLYGEDYRASAEILKYYPFAMLPVVLVIVAEYYLIALGRVIFAWLTLAFIPVQLGFIGVFHDNYIEFLVVIFLSGFSLFLCGYFLLLNHVKNSKNYE